MNLRKLFQLLLILNLSSCATITKTEIVVPDVYTCVDYDEGSGLCGKTVTKQMGYMTGPEWDKFKKRSVKFTPEGVGQLKAVILKLCKKTQSCVFKVIE